jgi:hypothetical protein
VVQLADGPGGLVVYSVSLRPLKSGIANSNPAGGTDVCSLVLVCVV